jgi:anti-anti-sigma factor
VVQAHGEARGKAAELGARGVRIGLRDSRHTGRARRSQLAPKSGSRPLSGGEFGNGYSLSRIARNGAGVMLALSGEIDIANADAFTEEVHSLIEDADGQVVLDLQHCLFIDSIGIRALIVLAREQQAQGRSLRLSGVTGEPLRVLELSGLLDSGLLARDP